MAFCLIQSEVNKFIKGLQSGEIDPEKLSNMSSEDRHDYLAKFVGSENAKEVNALFESKLLLKNQQTGMINWAKKIAGLTPKVRADLISRIAKLDRVLNPDEQTGFLKDLASKKLGTEVTQAEAKNVFDLSQKVQEAKTNIQEDSTFKTETDRLSYGRAKVALANYVNELKDNNKLTLKSITDVGGLSKSIRASMDDSAIFRQGWKTLLTNPTTWVKNASRTFVDIVKTVGGKEMIDEVNADAASRPNELNGNYKKMGLAVSGAEEFFPTTLPEKVPVLGRLYKASETAYTAFLYRTRMDIADKYLQIAKDQGLELSDKELKSVGSMVNSLTGKGNLPLGTGKALNSVFFSASNIKSQFDTLGHVITGAGGSNFVRRQAAINLVKVVSGIAAIMTVSNSLHPGSAETDPRSSDFGKIKVGDTRFDITGGVSSLITLASRLATMSSKSSVTGNITPLNSGKFGAKTGKDIVVDYLTNKLSPVGQVVTDLLNQKDRNGNPLTVGGELSNLGVPLSISTYQELKNDPNSANIVLSMIADGLGIATNTYGGTTQKQANWSTSGSKTLIQFNQKVGDTKFRAANNKYNLQYDSWEQKTVNNSSYKKLSSDEQAKVLTQGKAKIQGQVLKSYGFKVKPTRQTSQQHSTIKRLLPK